MLRVILAFIGLTTTLAAAMPFAMPPLALPAPSVPATRIPELSFFAGRQGGLSCTPSVLRGICGGNLYVGFDPRTVLGLIELFGSEERYRNALAASRVEVVHICHRTHNLEAPADYKEYDTLVLDEVQAATLKHALTSDDAYNWAPSAADFYVFPAYDLRTRLHHGGKVLTVDLSRSVSMIRVIENDAVIAEQPLSAYGCALLESLTELAERRE